jgi:hypothetical protein
VLRAAALLIPLVAPETDGVAAADGDRDRTLERIRRPLREPVSWPTSSGVRQRVLTGAAETFRAVADVLAAAADAIAP